MCGEVMAGEASSSTDAEARQLFVEPTPPPPPVAMQKTKSFRFADDVNGAAPRRSLGEWQGAQISGIACASQVSSPNLCAGLCGSQQITSTLKDSSRR